MLTKSKFSIWVALMLAVILIGAFTTAKALAQCSGGEYQSMHQQHMGSYGRMGIGSGQIGMGSGQMMSGQMGMNNAQAPAQADPNAVAPGVARVYNPAQDTIGCGQITGMDHSGRQH